MKKILLLNPPSTALNFSRDYFCSKTLKGDYVEHPIDFLVLSGILNSRFKVDVLDATALPLNFCDCINRINGFSPDIIIFLSGTASWIDDFYFMQRVKEAHPALKIVGIGDIFFEREIIVNHRWIDAVLLDFTTQDIVHYLEGRYPLVKNMFYRDGGSVIFAETTPCHGEEFEMPIPRHELFVRGRYTFPFARQLPFATILTDYGCGFECPFCFYQTLGFKLRKLEGVFEELRSIRSLGIRELFIKDQSFGHQRERTLQLCQEMIKNDWRFSWTAFSRIDSLDHEVASMMKEAGCHTLIVGIETANEDLLRKYKPGITLEKIDSTLKLCKKLKIRTVGTFCLGFPSETKESALRTIDYAKKSGCDFASFNVYVPKIGTVLEKEFLQPRGDNNLIGRVWDQSGIGTISGNGIISKQEMSDLLCLANWKFYCRFNALLQQAMNLKSVTDLKMLMLNGIGLFVSMMKRKFSRV